MTDPRAVALIDDAMQALRQRLVATVKENPGLGPHVDVVLGVAVTTFQMGTDLVWELIRQAAEQARR